MKAALVWFVGLTLGSVVHAQGLAPLSDEQMGDISGREGVLFSMEYYYNSVKTDDPATDGGINAAYCNASDLNCRFTWQIAGREDGKNHSGIVGADGEWLVYKDGYLSLSIYRLSFDASFLGNASSSIAFYESFYDPARYEDSDGNCLLEDVADCGNIAVAINTIRNMPALRTHYPGTSGSYDPTPGTTASIGYNDVRVGMLIGGLAVEYDNRGTPGPGYLQNEQGSFLGLRLADNNGPMAGIAFGGDFYLYGF